MSELGYAEVTTTITTVVNLDTGKSTSNVQIETSHTLPDDALLGVVGAACKLTSERMFNGQVTPTDSEGEEL